jgi:hypothetical protein
MNSGTIVMLENAPGHAYADTAAEMAEHGITVIH